MTNHLPTPSNKMRDYLVPAHASVMNFINNRHAQLKCKQRMVKADREVVAKLLENIEVGACGLCEECEERIISRYCEADNE